MLTIGRDPQQSADTCHELNDVNGFLEVMTVYCLGLAVVFLLVLERCRKLAVLH